MCLKTLAIEPFLNTWAKTTETGDIATQLTYIMALHHKCLSQSLKHLVRITARIRPHVCVSVSVCQWSPEIKDGGGGEIDRWSSWLRAVEGFLVISHVCFHEWESTDDVTRTIWTGATSAGNLPEMFKDRTRGGIQHQHWALTLSLCLIFMSFTCTWQLRSCRFYVTRIRWEQAEMLTFQACIRAQREVKEKQIWFH